MAVLKLALADLPAYLQAQADRLRGADLTVPLKVARQLLISATKQNFALGQSPDGIPWAPLKRPRSRKRDKSKKRRPGSIDLPLRDTDTLMNSVTAGDIDEISGGTLRYGTSLSYARYHQFGTKYIPRRQFLGLNDQLVQRINDVIRKYLQKLLRGQ